MTSHLSHIHNSARPGTHAETLSILGVRIANLSAGEAVDALEQLFREPCARTNAIYIVNAHTLNLAHESPSYRRALNAATRVFADGTGARWAARLRGVRMKSNLVGTDLMPELFRTTAGRGYRYFMLGADAQTIERAARASAEMHPGWELVGFHHGYVQGDHEASAVIDQINATRPHLLLVGMGNPVQELWIHRHRKQLMVPVSVGVGGLFDHWGGNLRRAPRWVRHTGFEWAQIMLQQPHKWRRYLLGNPKFLMRVVSSAPAEHARAAPPA